MFSIHWLGQFMKRSENCGTALLSATLLKFIEIMIYKWRTRNVIISSQSLRLLCRKVQPSKRRRSRSSFTPSEQSSFEGKVGFQFRVAKDSAPLQDTASCLTSSCFIVNLWLDLPGSWVCQLLPKQSTQRGGIPVALCRASQIVPSALSKGFQLHY